MPRKVLRPPDTLTDADCLAILGKFGKGPCGRRNVALFMMLWRTGLRLDEVLELAYRDLKRGPPAEARVRRGKGSTTRVVGIPEDAWAALEVWRTVRAKHYIGERVFCSLKGVKLDQGYVRRTLAAKGRRAGVERRVHPHALRHTFAKNMSKAGHRIELIRDALGHSTISVTDRYLRYVGSTDVVHAMTSRRPME